MLEGLLVDLVPFNQVYRDLEHKWRTNEAGYWGSGGDRRILTKARLGEQMAHWLEAQERGEGALSFGIQTKAGNPIGGIFMTWMVPFSRLAMLGARIGEPEYWGGGYGTDALLLVIDYAFNWLDMRKVWLSTVASNVRVTRQMEKVGFKLEARAHGENWMDGEWVDGLVYGLMREEWPGREALITRLGLTARL